MDARTRRIWPLEFAAAGKLEYTGCKDSPLDTWTQKTETWQTITTKFWA